MKSKGKKSARVDRQSSYRQAVGGFGSTFYRSIPPVVEQEDSPGRTDKVEANNNDEFKEKRQSACSNGSTSKTEIADDFGAVDSKLGSRSSAAGNFSKEGTEREQLSQGVDSSLYSNMSNLTGDDYSATRPKTDNQSPGNTSQKMTTNKHSLGTSIRVYDDVAALDPTNIENSHYDDVALEPTNIEKLASLEKVTNGAAYKYVVSATTTHEGQTTPQTTGIAVNVAYGVVRGADKANGSISHPTADGGSSTLYDDVPLPPIPPPANAAVYDDVAPPTTSRLVNAASSALYDGLPDPTADGSLYHVLTQEKEGTDWTRPERSDTLTSNETIYEPVGGPYSDDEDMDGWSSSEFEPIENSTEFVVQRTPNFLAKAKKRWSLPFAKPKPRNMKGKSFNFDVDKHPAAQLPDRPDGLTDKQTKRRYVVASIVEIENSYVQSLILLNESYKQPLLQNGIIGRDMVEKIFFKLEEILDCHLMFRIALHERIKNWDEHELLGDDFSAICKALVLEPYSEFVNNFMDATDMLRGAQREKSPFKDFINVQMKKMSDQVGPHGQMIKVVQRFPQYILQIKDLIKHTPPDHDDYLRLNIALSKLQNVAYQLNERKRSSEERLAARVILAKLNVKNPESGSVLLQRQDDVIEVTHGSRGEVLYHESRRLLLFNDMLCLIKIDNSGPEEKIKAKWTCQVRDVEYVEGGNIPNSNSLVRGSTGSVVIQNNTGFRRSSDSTGKYNESAARVHKELDDLMYDETVLSQIMTLSSALRQEYKGVDTDLIQVQLKNVQTSIRIRDEQLQMLDSCSISLSYIKSGQRTNIRFNMDTPARKQDWVMDFRAVKLAQETSNHVSRCWLTDVEKSNYPLIVKNVNVDVTRQCAEVTCATPIFLTSTSGGIGLQYLWVCSSNDEHGQVTLLSIHSNQPHIVESFKACNGPIDCCTLVPSNIHSSLDHVWMSDSTNRVYIHSLRDEEWRTPSREFSVPARVKIICCYGSYVFLGLADGSILKYAKRKGNSFYSEPVYRRLTDEQTPVSSLLPCDNNRILAACGNTLYILSVVNEDLSILDKHVLSDVPESSPIDKMIKLGYGIWFSCIGDPSLRLIHHETYRHISEVHIGSALSKLITDAGSVDSSKVAITTLANSQGLIWVGTNTGHILTIPVPILEGIPQQSGKANLSSMCHSGPVRFISTIQCSITFANKALTEQDLMDEPIDNSVDISEHSYVSINTVDSESETYVDPSRPLSSENLTLDSTQHVQIRDKSNKVKNRLGGILAKPKNFAASTPNLARNSFVKDTVAHTSSGLQRSSLGIYDSLMRLDNLDETTSTTQLISSLVPTNQLPQERQFTKISTVRGSVRVTKASSIADLGQLRPLTKNKRSGVQSMWSLNTTSSHSIYSVAGPVDETSKSNARTLDKAYSDVNVQLRDEENHGRYMKLFEFPDAKFGGRLPRDSRLSVSSLLSKVAEDEEYVDWEELEDWGQSYTGSAEHLIQSYTGSAEDLIHGEDENVDDDEVDGSVGKEEALVVTNFLKASLIVSGGEGFIDLHEPKNGLDESTLIMWQQNQIL